MVELTNTQLVSHPECEDKQAGKRRPEPPRIPPWRQDRDRQPDTSLVPHAAAIAAENAQHVLARRQSGVCNRPSATIDLVPFFFQRFKPVAIKVTSRTGEAKC